MSYTISFPEPVTSAADLRMRGNDELNRLREGGAGDETIEAARAVVAATADMLGTRYWGPGPYNVVISGHANEQHNPRQGWSNDGVSINISDARSVSDLENTSVTLVPDDVPMTTENVVIDQLPPVPGIDGDVEHPPAPENDTENRPVVPVIDEPATRADGSPIGKPGTRVDMDSDDPNQDAPTGQDLNEAAAQAAEDGNNSVVVPAGEPLGVDAPADTPQGDAELAPDGHDVTVEGAGEQLASVTEDQAAEAAAVGHSVDPDGNNPHDE